MVPCSDAGQDSGGGTTVGDAQQVALPWETEPGKLEGIAQLHQTREIITILTTLHPPFGIPVPWQQLRCIPWERHLWLSIFTPAKPSREAFTHHLLCPKDDMGVKPRTYWYFNKKQKEKESVA